MSHSAAYFVFLASSVVFVWVLAYLYTPFHFRPSERIESDVLTVSGEVISPEVLVSAEVDTDAVTKKRLRYTSLLLRYQKELAELESQYPLPTPEISEKIDHLRVKIKNTEATIAELVQ